MFFVFGFVKGFNFEDMLHGQVISENKKMKPFFLAESWKKALKEELNAAYFLVLMRFLEDERNQKQEIYPSQELVFAAFNRISFDEVTIVIIGQDPYHNEGQANGLCFSVSDGMRKPPSLLNIFKELQRDLQIPIPVSGNLERWADQGVLLLNATLTVRAHAAGSHQKKGWEQFTDGVIRKINDEKEGVIFMLWGNYAKAKGDFIDRSKHFVLEAAHPSPLARTGFMGCAHFSKANDLLKSIGKETINWNVDIRTK